MRIITVAPNFIMLIRNDGYKRLFLSNFDCMIIFYYYNIIGEEHQMHLFM